jgi:hypothetical protein
MDEAEASEPPGASPEPSYIGKIKMSCVSEDNVMDDSIAGEQNTNLSPEVPGEGGEMLGQFGRNDLPGKDAPPECTLQGASLGLLDS